MSVYTKPKLFKLAAPPVPKNPAGLMDGLNYKTYSRFAFFGLVPREMVTPLLVKTCMYEMDCELPTPSVMFLMDSPTVRLRFMVAHPAPVVLTLPTALPILLS